MMTEKHERRVKNITVRREAFPSLFREGSLITEGLPEDSELVNVTNNPDKDEIVFTVKSEEFEPVKEGDLVPEAHIEVYDTGMKQQYRSNY